MNIASIDIGTNTAILLIVEVDERKLIPIRFKNYYRVPRIGDGLKETRKIKLNKITQLANILAEFKDLCAANNCEKIFVFGTNALRVAENSNEILQRILENVGFKIEIISGDKEAELTFLGSYSATKGNGNKLIIDIGGGSTELIFGNNKSIIYRKSFPIGVVYLKSKFRPDDPPKSETIVKIREHISSTFQDSVNAISLNPETIAVAGTPTTLACIKQGITDYSDDSVEGSLLYKNDLEELTNLLMEMKAEEILEKFGNPVSGREDLILFGSLILDGIANLLKIDIINVSSKGVRYGYIMNYLISIK